MRLSFEPADIVNEVMSFGSPTPVDVSVNGPDLAEDRAYAEKVRWRLAKVPSLRDLQYVLSLDYPTVRIEIDRERAGLSGVTVQEVARSVVAATSSSRFVVPELLARPQDRHRLSGPGRDSLPDHGLDRPRSRRFRFSAPGATAALAPGRRDGERGTMPGEYDRYNMKRSVSLTANIAGEDLGRVAGHVAGRSIERGRRRPKGRRSRSAGRSGPWTRSSRASRSAWECRSSSSCYC